MSMEITFIDWLSKQNMSLSSWRRKWNYKTHNAKLIKVLNLLTFEEYLYKAYEARLMSSSQITRNGYHLARINDEGNYTVESCRFLWYLDNHKEIDWSDIPRPSLIGNTNSQGDKNRGAKLSNQQVINIWYDQRPIEEISISYNVSIKLIRKLKLKVTWSSITNKLT